MRVTNILTPRNGVIPVLVPETDAERALGMNVGVWPHSGMLFEFAPSAGVTMTMAETPMALQIVFFGPDGKVHTVHRAAPRSGLYRSGRRTRWVLETYANRRFYRPGDRLLIGV